MPRVLSYTPPWLNRPAPGHTVFEEKQSIEHLNGTSSAAPRRPGPKRTIARRGTEVFVAVKNELRWSDLVFLKEQWEEDQQQQQGKQGEDESAFTYRVLKAPIAQEIRQLAISPSGDYIAIATSHTVHVAILPDSSHLAAEDDTPLKLKTFQIGPTAHVLERSPVVSTLWHPLGVNGTCLVTLTRDATLRLWELDRDNRWSFDTPALAVDLKKLANGTSSAEDFSPSKYGITPGFSPDAFELEVAGSCFGGSGSADEDAWASMTLWVAMRGGDVYSLCPLLPRKWQAAPSSLDDIKNSVEIQVEDTASDPTATPRAKAAASALQTWLEEVGQNIEGSDEDQSQIFHRPARMSATPQLQGPYGYAPETEEIGDLSDIYVVAGSDERSLIPDEDEFEVTARPITIPFSTVLLASADGRVHILLDVDGIQPQWLPSRSSTRLKSFPQTALESLELLHVESISVCQPSKSLWSTFSPAIDSSRSFLVSHNSGVTHVDTSSWTHAVAEELSNCVLLGAEVRLGVLLDGIKSVVQHPVRLQNGHEDSKQISLHPAAAVNLFDSDLGNFLLTSSNGQAQAATLEVVDPEMDVIENGLPELTLDDEAPELPVEELRPAYQAPGIFWEQSKLLPVMDSLFQGRARHIREGEIRMSSATETAFLEAHRTLGQETGNLNAAAADLFRRCERMLEEFKDQIERVREARDRIDSVLDDDADTYEDRPRGYGTSDTIETRLQEVREKQEHLSSRCAELRRRVHMASGKALSSKERAWVAEVDQLDEVTRDDEDAEGQDDEPETSPMWQRLEQLRRLKDELLATSKSFIKPETEGDAMDTGSTSSPHRRTVRKDHIAQLLERETTLVDAIKARLARLSTFELD